MKNKILSISDLHMGHPKVPCIVVHDRLKKYFMPYIKSADIVFICGDVYHTLLNMSGQEARIATSFIIDLIKEAEKHNTIVRLIRGTYTHDRDQSKILKTIATRSKFDIDFEYYDTVSCEYIKKLDMRVAYIPDDIPFGSSDEVISHIKSSMDMMGWEYLNVVCGHGYFKHKLPPGMPHDPKITFREKQFSDILHDDSIVLMGHDHSMSKKGKVVYNGSFDRLAHGEEEKKGFIFIDRKIEFIENPDATIFKTIDLSQKDLTKDRLIEYSVDIVKHTHRSDHLGYYRIIHPRSEIRQLITKVLADKFKYLKFEHKGSNTKESDELDLTNLSLEKWEEIQVNEKNLPQMVVDFLQDNNNKYVLSEKEISDMLFNISI